MTSQADASAPPELSCAGAKANLKFRGRRRTALGESTFLNVGKRNLHLCADGSGDITVMFESGLGKSRSSWALTQPRIAQFARTMCYDRAGYGLSDPAPGPRTFEALLEDHLRVLDQAVETPCVIVAHSYGGPIARRAALARPNKVMAVVLVDEVPERAGADALARAMTGASVFYAAQVALARIGVLPALLRRTLFRDLDGPALEEAVREGGALTSARTAQTEWRSMVESLRRLDSDGPFVPESLVTEITTRRLPDGDLDDDFVFRSHRATADDAPVGRHVLADTTSHYIQFTQPDLVIAEAHRAVDWAVDRTVDRAVRPLVPRTQ